MGHVIILMLIWGFRFFKKGTDTVKVIWTTTTQPAVSWHTFQLTQGKSIASRKTPSSGPLVADVISMEDSITPERVATPNDIPMMRIP
jgi:hypothetical protein